MPAFRRRLVVALVAVSALAWPPTRKWIADVLICAGIHLDAAGRASELTPEQMERMRRRIDAEIAAESERRDPGGHARHPRTADSNGHKPVI